MSMIGFDVLEIIVNHLAGEEGLQQLERVSAECRLCHRRTSEGLNKIK